MQSSLKKSLGIRRQSRILALNALYLIDLVNFPISKIIDFFFNNQTNYPQDIKKFSCFLIISTIQNCVLIDKIIKKHLKNWTMDRLSTIDRNILRLSTCEFLFCPETPDSVIINEAIEIAKQFSTKDSGRFVNGLLDKIKLVRKDKEIIKQIIKNER